jgi:prepilin-type N-terminal cleavage/methylation domain-containing protein
MGPENQRGFSLLEVLVASVLLAIAVIGTGFLFVKGEVGVAEKGYGRGSLHAARSRIEMLQRLEYHHGDLSSGTH